MIPYSGFNFFYIMSILLIPAILLGLSGKVNKKYNIIVSLIMLIVIFGNSKIQSFCLAAFFLGELILVKLNLYIVKKVKNKWIMRAFVLLSLIPLLITKYSHFFQQKYVLGFLGVSYLTFKVIQIIVETYDGLIKEISIVEFAYFILFFPTISSGPIDRSRRFNEDFNKVLSKEEYSDLLKSGLYKLFQGILYKFIIGNLIFNLWLGKIPVTHTFLNTLNYMYAYSLYLFFDFAGYSRMAIGTSYILGVSTPENFHMPFLSKDIKDFWNRWHISLSTWFRDFIYTRYVMSSMKAKRFKSRYTASYIGYLITMITMGVWHGTQVNYIVYGVYHGALIVLTDYFQRKSKWYKRNSKKQGFEIAFTILTFNLVCFGFLIFSGYLFK